MPVSGTLNPRLPESWPGMLSTQPPSHAGAVLASPPSTYTLRIGHTGWACSVLRRIRRSFYRGGSRHRAARRDGERRCRLSLYSAFEAVHGASSCCVADGRPTARGPTTTQVQRFERGGTHCANKSAALRGHGGRLDEAAAGAGSRAVGMAPRRRYHVRQRRAVPTSRWRDDVQFPLRGGKAELWRAARGACFRRCIARGGWAHAPPEPDRSPRCLPGGRSPPRPRAAHIGCRCGRHARALGRD